MKNEQDLPDATETIAQRLARLYGQKEPDQAEQPATAEQVEQVREDIARLERKIDLIFGDHALIGGRFVQIGRLKI